MQNSKGQAINARFFEALDMLIGTREIHSFHDFCLRNSVDRRNLLRLRDQPTREFPMFLLGVVVLQYRISADWLLTGRGQMR